MPTLKKYILLTGATGYIGKHLLWQLLQQGYHVSVIVRHKKKCSRQRVLDVLKSFEPIDENYLQVVEGDLSKPDCGMDPSILEDLARLEIDSLIHVAALTRFDTYLADQVSLHNLQATKNVYLLADRLGIGNFHYLSTAYVAGDSSKLFKREDLDVGQNFNNPYEKSKYEAELYLREVCRTDTIRVSIYRPSIVVGGHPLGENNSVGTIYTFIRALHFIRECCRRDLQRGDGIFTCCGVSQNSDTLFIPLRIAADPKIRINLVSIECVVNAICKGLATKISKFNVKPLLGNDYSLHSLHGAISHALGVRGICFTEISSFNQSLRNVLEEKFYRATSSYQSYLFSTINFNEDDKDNSDIIDIERIALEFTELLDIKTQRKRQGDLNRHALNTLGVAGANDYFHLLVNGQLGKSFIKRITYVDVKIRFLISGDDLFDQIIHFEKGHIHYANGNDFDFSYEIAPWLFNDIVNGKITLKDAFFDGKIGIEGNKETALKFGYLFGDHFLNIDDRIMEEVIGQ